MRNQVPGHSIGDQFGDASHMGSNDRETGAHRLDNAEGQTLVPARQDENVGGGKQGVDLIRISGESDSLTYTKLLTELLHGDPVGTVTSQRKLPRLLDTGQCMKQ